MKIKSLISQIDMNFILQTGSFNTGMRMNLSKRKEKLPNSLKTG